MQTIDLFTRLTNRYVGTFDHLNEREPLCTVRATPGRVVDEGNYHDTGPTVITHLTAPAGANRPQARRIIRAIQDTMTSSGCHHDYDCCGCASYYTRARRVARNRYVAITRVTFNH